MNELGEYFESIFKEIVPLGNLHILESEQASEILAIFLSLDNHTFNLFWQSSVLQNLCEKYCKTLSFKGILQVQYTLLLNIHKVFLKEPRFIQNLLKKVLENLNLLEQHDLAKGEFFYQIKRHLDSIIHQEIKESHMHKEQQKLTLDKSFLRDFLTNSLRLLEQKKEILNAMRTQNLLNLNPSLEELESLLEKLRNQHFSIGITGVLSAGKSTLLNALLGQEILGSSTIPETASLTLLKYDKTPSALVSFWNKAEWKDLKSTMEDSLLREIMANAEFKEFLEKYVQDSTTSLRISLQELPKYTSANHPSKLCNLIKETTLFTPLKFLENKVEIVDTPGLDDPIVQREEITKGYILDCDLLIHAMNAAQSATQIDVDFILQTLQNANISRILILLTHADLLEPKDLESALNYTKESIKTRLSQSMAKQSVELLLQRLDFIALASYPALLCQTNPQKAKELGFSLESSNFNALIDYLNQTLLGSNSTKAKDLVYLSAQGFTRVFEKIKSACSLEKSLLFAKESQIQELMQEAKFEKEQSLAKLQVTKESLKSATAQLQEYLVTLQKELNQQLETSKNILSERIFADIIYDYEKGKIPSYERLQRILDLGLKDVLSDILRFCTQSLDKKITQLQSQFEMYVEFQEKDSSLLGNFHLHFDESILKKTTLKILNRMIKSVKKFGKNQKIELKSALDLDFKDGFLEFFEIIIRQSKALESKLTENFQRFLNDLEAALKTDLENKERILQNALQTSQQSTQEKTEKEMLLTQNEVVLEESLQCFGALQDYATQGA
ncbi:dynamin family protein [uncultured Helicobacter sp.]|uniref:dynamin family protein n=1 Tax=uncultured Helicobacter sp. TaxID=175537 RepID=UPI00261B9C00|nr:dynamin family protein [uncultured Helicobacter sp.]